MNTFINSHPDQNLNDVKQSQCSKSIPRKRPRAACSVDRSLALTLYVSRLFGVAPVSFKKKLNSIFVSASPEMSLYSWLLLFAFHASIIYGLVLDFNVDSDRSVRVRSATSSLAWLTEVLVVTALMTFGVYNGPERMNCMVHCLNVIEKVTSKIHKQVPVKHIERTIFIIGILFLLIGNLLYLFDFYTFVYEALRDGKDMKVVCLYLSFYLEFMATFPLELQFVGIVMKIVSAQKAINNALTDFVRQIDSRASQFSRKDTEVFRHLIVSYGSICDVVRQINDSNAVLLILQLLSFFQHLVVAPYYLICFWDSTKHYGASTMLQIFMCIFHTINLMIIVEPAHRSTEEMEHTHTLLGQLARRITNANEPLFHELDLFYKQVVLNRVSFTPMGMCSLRRSIITTMFGSITTYLVIILQYRALDKQNW